MAEIRENSEVDGAVVENLEPSDLGTKQHWDKTYAEELKTLDEHGVMGDIWFGEDIMMKIVRYIEDSEDFCSESPIIDLGCGNGALLLELARSGYANLKGVDYSENALKVAEKVFSNEEFTETKMLFQKLDILSPEIDKELARESYQICLDKGTFDAISLCPDISQETARSLYFSNVSHLLQTDGQFILTSCNWTHNELVCLAAKHFSLFKVIPTQGFKFGGVTGSVVSIVVFKKKTDQSS